jgi:hypothetical protein
MRCVGVRWYLRKGEGLVDWVERSCCRFFVDIWWLFDCVIRHYNWWKWDDCSMMDGFVWVLMVMVGGPRNGEVEAMCAVADGLPMLVEVGGRHGCFVCVCSELFH